MSAFHLAQVNIGRMLGPLDGPLMAGFVARLDEINALADESPGFVWRFQTAEGNATALRHHFRAWCATTPQSYRRQFRGPAGSGVAFEGARPPTRIGPDTNVKWKVAIPPGISSPVRR